MKPKTFQFFVEKGLNKKSNQKSTICLLLKNKVKQTKDLISYSFNCCNDPSRNDIPFFHKEAPDGFSLFCTQDEYTQILSYIKKDEYKLQLMQKMQKKEEEEKILNTEPEPSKKGFICHICKTRFDNYLEHIKSKLHENNKLKYVNVFNKMKMTFNRIVEYNKKSNNTNNNNKINDITFQNNTIDNTTETTKEESFVINEDNKICQAKNEKKKKLEKIAEKENEDEKKEDISLKEIMLILDSINEKEKENLFDNKKYNKNKRKKNEKRKYFLNDNYILDLQKMTGKIGYFINLFKKNQ